MAACALYITFFVLQTFAVEYLQTDHHLSARQAAFATSLFDVFGIFLGPFLGRCVDRELGKGEGNEWVCMSCRPWPAGSMLAWGSGFMAVGLLLPIVDPRRWVRKEARNLVREGKRRANHGRWRKLWRGLGDTFVITLFRSAFHFLPLCYFQYMQLNCKDFSLLFTQPFFSSFFWIFSLTS